MYIYIGRGQVADNWAQENMKDKACFLINNNT